MTRPTDTSAALLAAGPSPERVGLTLRVLCRSVLRGDLGARGSALGPHFGRVILLTTLPLVRLMLDARDPESGDPLSDQEISDELLVFFAAGRDTSAGALAYALWALGHEPEIQQRVADEAAAFGDRALTVEDVGALSYTVQVVRAPYASAHRRLSSRGTPQLISSWMGTGCRPARRSLSASTRFTRIRPCGNLPRCSTPTLQP